jgi:hypothetical protein
MRRDGVLVAVSDLYFHGDVFCGGRDCNSVSI